MSGALAAGFAVAGAMLPLAVAVALWLYLRRRRRVAAAIGERPLVARLAGEDLFAVPRLRMLAVLLAATALGAALFDPRWGAAEERAQARGGRVALVLDASSSMLAADLRPNRLERQREAARSLARALPDASLAVVVFAGRAYALMPPTADRAALELYLDALDPQMVTQTGSSLSAAIRQGLGLLAAGEADPSTGALVLITDGDALEPPAQIEEAVALARRAGVQIHVLGAGTVAGAPVPDVDFATGDTVGFKQEQGGGVAVSRLNEELLRRVAQESGGEYAALEDPGAPERIAGILREGAGGGGGPSDRSPPRFAWFASAALLLLVLESLGETDRRGRRR